MFRRRRPLLGAAMIGGTAYAAGKSSIRNQQREDEEQARLEALEYQSTQPPPAAGGPTDLAAKLTELKGLVDQGVLTDDEFTAAKQKLLAG
jgi:Short C-terminal domain